MRERIIAKLKGLGFLYVTLDLEGYVTGSMNRALEVPKVSLRRCSLREPQGLRQGLRQ